MNILTKTAAKVSVLMIGILWLVTSNVLAQSLMSPISKTAIYKQVKEHQFSLQKVQFRANDISQHLVVQPIVPVASFALKPNIRVESIRCIRATSGSDTDSIYVSITDDRTSFIKRSSVQRMKAGDVWKPELSGRIRSTGTIKLYEDDFLADDLIGQFKYQQSRMLGKYVVDMKGDDGVYEVIIEVTAKGALNKEEISGIGYILKQDMEAEKKRIGSLENQLFACVKKYGPKHPGTNVTKSWCKQQFFAVEKSLLRQCQLKNEIKLLYDVSATATYCEPNMANNG